MSNTTVLKQSQHLLALAKNICQREEALTQASGERFNLFRILHMDHYEVRTHSPMLKALLDPKGSHGQGSIFLKHFLSEIKIDGFNAKSAHVETEVPILGGRLDIVITAGNRSIFIENKIYAALQDKQLERYHEHNPKANLLFLTLNGEDPWDWEKNDAYKTVSFKNAFQTVSYKTHIVGWLERCRKEAATAPGVREVITQYIHLIQHLTQQNTNARMNEELIKAVLNGDKKTYLAYAALRNAYDPIRRKIIEKLNSDVRANLPEGLYLTKDLGGNGVKDEFYVFSTPEFQNHELEMRIGFVGKDCCFGFYNTNHKKNKILDPDGIVQKAFKEEFGSSDDHNHVWHASQWMKERRWDDEVLAEIQYGEFYKKIISVAEGLKRVADKICQGAGAV